MPKITDNAYYAEMLAALRMGKFGAFVDETETLEEDQTKWIEWQRVLAFGAWAGLVKTVTASGDVDLEDSDYMLVEIDPDGADRDVNLPTKGADNHLYLIRNVGSANTLTVKLSGETSIGDAIGAGDLALVAPSSAHDFEMLIGGGGGGGGGTSLICNDTTVTTANVSASANNVYNCTIAGLTANRNFVLPTPSAAGEIIRVNVLDGDADYALILIGDAGVTINGGSAATEWSRLYTAGETVTLESTSTSNWQVIEDGRIPSVTKIYGSSSIAQSIPSASTTVIEFDNVEFDNAAAADLANNRVDIRRDGKYFCFAAMTFVAATTRAFGDLFVSSATRARDERGGASTNTTPTVLGEFDLTPVDYVQYRIYQDSGWAVSPKYSTWSPILVVQEVFDD